MKIKSYFLIPGVEYKIKFSFDDNNPKVENISLRKIKKYKDALGVESLEQLYNEYYNGDIKLCPFCGIHYEKCDFDLFVDKKTHLLNVICHKRKKHMCEFKDCMKKRKIYNPNSIYFVMRAYDLDEKSANEYIISRNKSPFYFHPEEETLEEYKNRQKRNKNWFINEYGEEKGIKRWEDRNKVCAFSSRKDILINKYGKEYADEVSRKKAITLENLINKYGEEGEARYNEWLAKISLTSSDKWKKTNYSFEKFKSYKDKCAYNSSKQKLIDKYGLDKAIEILKARHEKNTKQYWLENFGETATKERFKSTDTRSLTSLIKKYGVERAQQKYIEARQKYFRTKHPEIYKNILGYHVDSKQAYDFFTKLHSLINKKLPAIKDEDIFYADGKGRQEYRIDYIYDNKYRWYKLDFTILSLKIDIEFNGAFYHPKIDANDEYIKEWNLRHPWQDYNERILLLNRRNDIIKNQNNFNVIEIWDYDMKYGNEINVLNETFNKIQEIYEKFK